MLDPDARKPFWETGLEVWNSFIDVNLYGVINCASACIPRMIAAAEGHAVGGGLELCLSCDLIVAARRQDGVAGGSGLPTR